MKKLSLIIALSLPFAGWTTPPPQPPRKPFQSEHTRPPADATYRDLTEAEKQAVIKVMRIKLKDPESARFEWPQIVANQNDPNGINTYCGFVNAKNGFGGYTGFTLYFAVIGEHYKTGEPVGIIIDIGGDTAVDVCVLSGYLNWKR